MSDKNDKIIKKFTELVETVKDAKMTESTDYSNLIDSISVGSQYANTSPSEQIISDEDLDKLLTKLNQSTNKIKNAVEITKFIKSITKKFI